uniref:AAA+ ATPase domain-containing protein n=1 Tax=Leersia perrieri TaxID=77586 RepID=A0A0D9W3R0_9ORYZ
MAANLITSLLSQGNTVLSSIRASLLDLPSSPSSSSSSSTSHDNSKKERQAVVKNLERLMQTMQPIKAALYDAEEKEIRERSVKLWLKEIKRAAYDADDVLSEYRYEATRVQVEARKASEASGTYKRKHMEASDFFIMHNRIKTTYCAGICDLYVDIVPIPDGMVDRLNKTSCRFDEIENDRVTLQLIKTDGTTQANNATERHKTSHMLGRESIIFGREADVTEIINHVLSENHLPFSVISIIGKGGLGKTTIAQLIYKDTRARQYFDLFGWVCVSENFEVERMFKATWESFTRGKFGRSELRSLQEELLQIVKDKKVLLVLDDVWNEDPDLWESFIVPLKQAKWVCILVTTRNEKVAKAMLKTTIFKPDHLPEDVSWQLFQYYAFGNRNYSTPTQLVEMGREITRKCAGIPLAVKSIASLLSACILNLTKFEALRVMEVKFDHLREVPSSIVQLKHLNHLRIESEWLETLPESIGLLYNLQVFILDCFTSPLDYLPESIGCLANLQYLHIECAEFKEFPKSLCLLSNLRRLVIRNDDHLEEPSDIGKLCNLRELIIDCKELIKAIPDTTIGCLSSLEELEFPGCLSSLENSVDAFPELPGALGNCHKLQTIKAYACLLDYKPLAHSLDNFHAMKRMAACLRVETIGWLKDMKNLEGELIIEGLENISNLKDAQRANLKSKYKIETLDLCWHSLREHDHDDGWEELTIRVFKECDEDTLITEDMNFRLLECLQPHRHLKKLVLEGYPSSVEQCWIGDPLSFQAIQEIRLISCAGIKSLPFSNFLTLKHFKIQSCSGFQDVHLDQLPFQLENLDISWCDELETITGLQCLGMLASLEIKCCKALKLIMMDKPQLVERPTEPEPGSSSSHDKKLPDGRKNSLSLTKLVVLCCPRLPALPYQLQQSRPSVLIFMLGTCLPVNELIIRTLDVCD